MERLKKSVNWDPWMVAALDAFGKRNGKDFSESVRYLVESELVDRGYTRKEYEPGIVDSGGKTKATVSKRA